MCIPMGILLRKRHMEMISFIIGLIIGFLFGFTLTCCVVAGGKGNK